MSRRKAKAEAPIHAHRVVLYTDAGQSRGFGVASRVTLDGKDLVTPSGVPVRVEVNDQQLTIAFLPVFAEVEFRDGVYLGHPDDKPRPKWRRWGRFYPNS